MARTARPKIGKKGETIEPPKRSRPLDLLAPYLGKRPDERRYDVERRRPQGHELAAEEIASSLRNVVHCLLRCRNESRL